MIKPIYPCLWFNGQAKAAATFYCSVFQQGHITTDTPMVVNFELYGQKFMGLNGGPQFKINPSISFFVVAETLEESNDLWQKLSEGGSVLMPYEAYDWSEKYGWLVDKFGVSWQISLGKIQDVGQKISPTLLFTEKYHGKAEQAVNYYTSLFDQSSIAGILKYKAGESEPEGTVNHAQFTIHNYILMAMDSSLNHAFTFNEAVSFVVECETQAEIDFYWNNLTKGGKESMCGWLQDQFGVWWQIIPSILGKLMSDPSRSERVIQAFLKMKKFEIEKLLNA